MQRQAMMQQFRVWWEPLAQREKRMLQVGAVGLAVLFFYAGILSPLNQHVSTMRKQAISNQETLQFMRAAQKQLGLNQGKAVTATAMTPVELLSDLQQRFTQAGMMQSVTELKQVSDSTVMVTMHQVDFDRVMRLLLALTREVAVSIEHFSATASDTPGVVDVRLQFKS